MSGKIDYKKDYKAFYVPKTVPEIIDVPSMPFISIEGTGDPNAAPFAESTGALYSLTYAVKMSYKSDNVPAGYYEYTVFPLEGIWDLVDHTKPSTDKSNLKFKIMIRQPDFLTPEQYARFFEQTKKKKPNPRLDDLRFETLEDGPSCQMMHLGRFEDEPASFARMEAFCEENGWTRKSKLHREIYLSDPRKTVPEKRKTVLRFAVEAKRTDS
ncbi:GyrI-like domain-containing protein [Saccharibacillus qingshengii]|uniref:GyrI-like domain-containing protein n=1 Tax=Saccharibacillus qingshengii TaxID=1763540 RepID=UPI00155281A2|nr:GyrI-like domain-containing protein [Saccharibacillus qingshengii]